MLRGGAVFDQAPLPAERIRHDAIEIVVARAPAEHLADAVCFRTSAAGSPTRGGPKRTAKSPPEARFTAAITSIAEKPLP